MTSRKAPLGGNGGSLGLFNVYKAYNSYHPLLEEPLAIKLECSTFRKIMCVDRGGDIS